MKSIIFVALILAIAYCGPLNLYEENKMVKFDFDISEDSPVGLFVKGEIDPRNDNSRKIQAFIKLANQYIPILEQIADAENNLTWNRRWHVGVLGFNVDITAEFSLIVGWRVTPGGYTTDRFDVIYTPFVWGGARATFNGTSFPAVGSADVGVRYVDAYAPIAFTLYKAGRVCFRGSYVVETVHLRNHLFAALNACQDEILDDLINGHTIFEWRCNYTNPVNITIWDVNFTDAIRGDFIGETCIGL